MNIAFCADRKYIEPLCVALNSVVLSNKNEELKFYIISADFTENEKAVVERVLSQSPQVKTEAFFLSVKDEIFEKLPTMEHISIATYYRLLLPEILPAEINEVLYLDGDLLCLDDLSPFYNQDFEGYALSASRDFFNDDIMCYNRLEYPFENGYFNAGVLMINLKYWRENKIAEKAIEYISRNPEKCDFSDQDALNKVLNGKVLWTDFRYNCIISFYKHLNNFARSKISIKYKDAIESAVKNPCIVHFTGGVKPWHEDYRFVFRGVYRRIYELTFNNELPKRFSIRGKELLKWKIKELLTGAGIKTYFDVMMNETFKDIENLVINKFCRNI